MIAMALCCLLVAAHAQTASFSCDDARRIGNPAKNQCGALCAEVSIIHRQTVVLRAHQAPLLQQELNSITSSSSHSSHVAVHSLSSNIGPAVPCCMRMQLSCTIHISAM